MKLEEVKGEDFGDYYEKGLCQGGKIVRMSK
jgi:hypothetical protein